jgi:Cytochrome c
MKLWVKIFLVAIVIVVVVIGVGAVKVLGTRAFLGPRSRPLTARTYERTPQRLARGKYLVDGVLLCRACHSPHDWSKHDAPTPAGMDLSGQMLDDAGLPGRVVAPNLTPDAETGAGSWSDDALSRAIREGIGHDGRALFGVMPYATFHDHMSDEDLASVVVYLRSLPPVHHPLPKTQIAFPLNYIMRNWPAPLAAPVPDRTFSSPQQRGEFLVQYIGCPDCHTPVDTQHDALPGMDLAGGQFFDGPWGKVASANLTPDPSGIPYYDKALFIRTMRSGYVGSRQLNALMPWWIFRNMSDEELGSIFAYLKTIKPVSHHVDNSLPPTLCPIDGATHGGGEHNKKP